MGGRGVTEQTATQNSGEFSRALVYLRRLWLRLLGIREMPMLVLEQESAMPPVLVLEPPPVSAPTPDPLPDLPPEPARPRRAPRQTARLKKDVLDQLEAYQVYKTAAKVASRSIYDLPPPRSVLVSSRRHGCSDAARA